MSFQAYRDFISKHPVVRNTPAAFMVQRAGGNIQRAVGLFFARQQMSSRLSGYAWEFNLVQDKAKNAWCMPGGKVCVYTGILPVTRDESGLAVVMGHEIAHAVANHSSERMSHQLMVQMGGVALSTAMAQSPHRRRTCFSIFLDWDRRSDYCSRTAVFRNQRLTDWASFLWPWQGMTRAWPSGFGSAWLLHSRARHRPNS